MCSLGKGCPLTIDQDLSACMLCVDKPARLSISCFLICRTPPKLLQILRWQCCQVKLYFDKLKHKQASNQIWLTQAKSTVGCRPTCSPSVVNFWTKYIQQCKIITNLMVEVEDIGYCCRVHWRRAFGNLIGTDEKYNSDAPPANLPACRSSIFGSKDAKSPSNILIFSIFKEDSS